MIQGSGLTPENIADRERFAGSCMGCHQAATGIDLGRGVESPRSLGFVHVFDFHENCVDDTGENCFATSPALNEVFLPHRKTVMERFLHDSSPRAAMTQDIRTLHTGQDRSTISRATRAFTPSQEPPVPRTLGGQPMGATH